MYSKELLEIVRCPGHPWYVNFIALRVTMGTANKKSGSEDWAVFVSYSYRHSKSVLVHAAGQDCKDKRGVVDKILDESSVASPPKIFNALKTSVPMICTSAVSKPLD